MFLSISFRLEKCFRGWNDEKVWFYPQKCIEKSVSMEVHKQKVFFHGSTLKVILSMEVHK